MVTSEKDSSGDHRLTCSYYVTRDSKDGVLADKCDLWAIKPLRSRQGERVCWIPRTSIDHGHLGAHTPELIMKWFNTKPDTDLELICVEQWWIDPATKTTATDEVQKPAKRRRKIK